MGSARARVVQCRTMLGRRLCCAFLIAFACADRAEDDPPVKPVPGERGGLCLAPDGHCAYEGTVCNRDHNYCYDPEDPCDGFACGGSERGTCIPEDGQPTCECAPGFDNTKFDLYCCPIAGGDPDCV